MRDLQCPCGEPLIYAGVGRPPQFCAACREERRRAYQASPEYRRLQAERKADPEYKRKRAERQREYAKTDRGREVGRRAKKKYNAKPERKAANVEAAIRHRKTEKGAASYARARARYTASRKGIIALRAAQAVSKYRLRGGQGPIYKVARKDTASIIFAPCFACGSTQDVEIEHLIPIQRGGSHGIGNLLPLCTSCNNSKRNRTWMEWRVSASKALPAHLRVERREVA